MATDFLQGKIIQFKKHVKYIYFNEEDFSSIIKNIITSEYIKFREGFSCCSTCTHVLPFIGNNFNNENGNALSEMLHRPLSTYGCINENTVSLTPFHTRGGNITSVYVSQFARTCKHIQTRHYVGKVPYRREQEMPVDVTVRNPRSSY